MDNAIFKALWSWARRRHRTKTSQWIKDQYFRRHDSSSWVLMGTLKKADGTIKEFWLVHASSVPIRRHIKVREYANPYDPAWKDYFRHRIKVRGNLKGLSSADDQLQDD